MGTEQDRSVMCSLHRLVRPELPARRLGEVAEGCEPACSEQTVLQALEMHPQEAQAWPPLGSKQMEMGGNRARNGAL